MSHSYAQLTISSSLYQTKKIIRLMGEGGGSCVDSENFVRVGSIFFLVDEGRGDPNTTINSQALARQQNAIFKWRFAVCR